MSTQNTKVSKKQKRQRAKASIEKRKGLIGGKYFSQVENAKKCHVCAIGALIQDLPDENFDKCVEYIKSDGNPYGGNTNSVPHVNGGKLALELEKYYGLDADELNTLQITNDEYVQANQNTPSAGRKNVVLKTLNSILGE